MRATHLRSRDAFTLLEMLIVLVVIGALAGMMMPRTDTSAASRLQAVAGILGRDIAYARNLAVTNADNYKITFDLNNNRWILTHSGPNTALDNLPITPLHRASEPANQQIVSLNELPSLGGSTRLHAVWALTTPPQTATDVEFLPLGETTRTQGTLIWLAAGTGAETRYISVRVNPITGLYWVENYRYTGS
jgi:prepilin-type N-terminal cleavage/methylation domain-containing protein